ncbi:MAG: class I SAM-dependent methyltransferase [Zetaproteobacteria bacterium]|nr:MAG: class I SAM-dependent methyltransferase [Zetaproteobacteria bacterium]
MTLKQRHDCRLCHGEGLIPVLELTPTPPANAFVTEAERHHPQPCYPLTLMFCPTCHHLQLQEVLDAATLFRHYLYVSGTSPAFVRHFTRYADQLRGLAALEAGALVVEIGSNDGTMLRRFRQHGCRVVGVDPAIEIGREATASGIPTITAFFTRSVAAGIVEREGKARCIVANNVLAHVDDLDEILHGVRLLLADDGLFAFEVSWFADVIDHCLFDTIYHEHLDYHTVAPLRRFLRRHEMELVGALPQQSHGGSIRCLVRHRRSAGEIDASVAQAIARERSLGLDRPETIRAFGRHIDAAGARLQQLLAGLTQKGRRIIAYGAPAKATTLMYHFDIDSPTIEAIIDDNPRKQGRYSPGKHLPIVDASILEHDPPDCILILAWNFAEAIMEKLAAFRAGGGRILVPLPQPRLI